MTDPADIFNRTRALTGELSAAILEMSLKSSALCIARRDQEFEDFERACASLGKVITQACQMQMVLASQIEKEPRADVVDMRGIGIGRRG